MTGGGVPHSDVVDGACGEEVRVTSGERNVVDSFIMAGVSEFGVKSVGVGPVNSGLVGSYESVGTVSGEGNRGDSTHDLCFLLHEHVFSSKLGNSTVSSTNHDVTVAKKFDGVDSEREQSLGGTTSFEQ